MKTILAVDDESSVRQSYRLLLADAYRVVLAEDAHSALDILKRQHVDLVLLDLNMPGMGGIEFLEELSRMEEGVPVVVVTAMNSVSTAVKAMKAGAREYVIKPFNVEEVLMLIERILNEQRNKVELKTLREAGSSGFDAIIGESPALLNALEVARQATSVDSTVLITGESGTGKDLLARAIHHGGVRGDGAFVPMSCCAIPAQLLESELFGHEKGAFTGATSKRLGKIQAADNGSLFLDEIGEMPLEAQAKLLRVLQDNCICPIGSTKMIEVNVRFICATNRDLPEEVREGRFREDLFYRINVLPIEMPPLRRRREDIPGLVGHFAAKYAPKVGAKVEAFAPEAMALLNSYRWPGNIRELENMIQRVLVCNRDRTTITAECLPGIVAEQAAEAALERGATLHEFEGLPLDEAVRRLESHLITRALDRTDYVQSRAAVLLGTTRRILKYKMDQLGIDSDAEVQAEAV